MPVIVYIIGVGHSGSTLLDLLLGSHSKACSVGELIALSTSGKPGRQERILARRCDCGAPTKLACPFWNEVDRRLQGACGKSLSTIDLDTDDPATFLAANRAVYEAIAQVSGRSFIIDSSKGSSRYQRLVEAGFDVRPIHIVREPQGVVASHLRKGRNWWSHCLAWSRHALRARRVLADHEHLRIHYEELAMHPGETVRAAMDWLGLTFEPDQLRFRRATHHQLAGNNMRRKGDDSIRLDRRWKNELSLHQRWLTGLLTLPARLRLRGAGVQGPRR
jgi:Sulfotransferase family